MPGVTCCLVLLHDKIPVAFLAHPDHRPLMVNLITGEANELHLDPLAQLPGTPITA